MNGPQMNGPQMNGPQQHADIAGYLLGILDAREVWWAEQHLAGCESCHREVTALRAVEALLDGVPPELFLDGPDPDDELLVQRTLRRARAETATRRVGRAFLIGAAAVAVLVFAIGGGFAIGRSDSGTNIAGPTPEVSSPVAGTRTGTATDATTGAKLTATVVPAAGWVRVHATVSGIKEGERCRILVVDKSGNTEVAGSWVIGPKAAEYGLAVDGDALVDPADVAAVRIDKTDGTTLVKVPI
jgi:hypothetical protein